MVLNQSRHKHEELAFAAERHFSDLVRNAADLYAVEQRRPFLSSVDGQSDMVDARGSRGCPRGARLLDQVDDRLPICVQPVAVHAKWWTRTLAQANDGAKETPRGFGVLGDDRCMVKLHGENKSQTGALRECCDAVTLAARPRRCGSEEPALCKSSDFPRVEVVRQAGWIHCCL